MAKIRKAVVLTRIDGEERQLFSIEERLSGDLTIIIKRGLRGETIDGTDKGVVLQRKISIHRSPDSATNNIVYAENCDGITTRLYAQILPNRFYGNGIRWPIYAFRTTNLPEAAYTPKVRTADRRIDLGDFTSTQWSLAVIIIARESNMPLVKHWSLNHSSVAFSHFIIDVMWTYIKVPTTTLGEHLFFATKQKVVDGIKQDGVEFIDAECPAPYELNELQDHVLAFFGDSARRKIARIARESGEIVSDEVEDEWASRPFLLSGTMRESS